MPDPTKRIDHMYTSEVTCPHCGHEVRDSWEFDDDGEWTCGECEQDFTFERIVSCSYCTSKPKSKAT